MKLKNGMESAGEKEEHFNRWETLLKVFKKLAILQFGYPSGSGLSAKLRQLPTKFIQLIQYCISGASFMTTLLVNPFFLLPLTSVTLGMSQMWELSTSPLHSFCAASPKVWYDLPVSIRSMDSLSSFKKNLKTSFLVRLWTPSPVKGVPYNWQIIWWVFS